MLRRISAVFVLTVLCAYGYQIDYRLFKLEVLPIYPAKTSIYEKEPVFIRFDIQIKDNRTGIKKELLLNSIKIQPVGKKVLLYSQQKYIHPEEKKLVVENIVYYKKGENLFPFTLWFGTEKLKNVLSKNLITLLSKKVVLKRKKSIFIYEIPYNTPYVGSFKINTYLKGEKGLATLTIRIKGKGFPSVPNYQLVVKNGSAKKTQFVVKNKMGYVESIQKFKISYMEEVEVLPVTFKFFDPYQEKVVKIKTKTLKILSTEKKRKEQIKPMSEEEKIKLQIKKFKHLYPEFFNKSSSFEDMLNLLITYRGHIAGTITLIFIISLFVLRRFLQTYINSEIKEIINIKLRNINDFKKLYKYFPTEKLPAYLSEVEKLLFKSEIKDMRGRILYLKSGKKVYTSAELTKIFENMKWEIIKEKIENLSQKKKLITITYYLLNRHSDSIFSLALLFLITGIIQLFIEEFPQYWKILTLINVFVIIVFFLYITVISKKINRVGYVRNNK